MEENELTSWMQEWFERFMGRFDQLDKFMEAMTSRHNVINGERLLDNHDLCKLLNVSKRTLQHYRDTGVLPFAQIGHKCYYKREDVEQLLQTKTEKAETGKTKINK
mgnify:CR=1 FL=1